MPKDKLATQQKLLGAVHALLTEEGIEQVRINRVATRASVNKVLIYRYFGGIEGLLQAYYDQYQPYIVSPLIELKQLEGAPLNNLFKASSDYVLNEFRLLRANPQAQQVLRSNLLTSQPNLSTPVARQKQQQLDQMVEEIARMIDSPYARSFATVIFSGMTLITFLAQDKRTIMGIDLDSEEGWTEIEAAIKRIFYGLYLATKDRIGDVVPTSSPDEQSA